MKANKRIRDLNRRSYYTLRYTKDGVERGITTWPFSKLGKPDQDGVRTQDSIKGIRIVVRGTM